MEKIKVILLITCVLLGMSVKLVAQDSRLSMPNDEGRRRMDGKPKVDTLQMKVGLAHMWKISPRFGEMTPALRDTARINFHQSTLTDGQDVSMSYLGNIGSPSQSNIFFNREETSRFIFLDAMSPWRKGPEDHLFANHQIPYSNIHYQTGGGALNKEELLKIELTTNFGKKVNVGMDFDYLYARGYYKNAHNKQINYDAYGSYTGDRYQMHAYFANNNFKNTENGGILNMTDVTRPGDIDKGEIKSSLDVPVRLGDNNPLWNRLRGRHLFVTNRYSLGEDSEMVLGKDSVMREQKKENYIYPASIVLTTHYSDQRRQLVSNSIDSLDRAYKPYYYGLYAGGRSTPKYDEPISDEMSYQSFKNTLALEMNEGFRPWLKFGLTAFIEADIRGYELPDLTTNKMKKKSENSLIVGGVLSSEKGKLLRYRVSAEKDILKSDFKAEGQLFTDIRLMNKDITVRAKGHIKNISPSFYQNTFSSKYWNWKHDFSDTRRLYVGGEIEIPSTRTKLTGGVETIDKYIYYNEKGIIAQSKSNVQVVSLSLDQKLTKGVLNWENKFTFQTTSNDEVIPLPSFSGYTNVYLLTHIAKVLTLQLGIDAHFHSKYYMPGYEPLTMQFYNQREMKLGNFPISTAYVNLHLKNTRFFVMMYNVFDEMANSNSFAAYRYPINPRIVKFGLSWNFNN